MTKKEANKVHEHHTTSYTFNFTLEAVDLEELKKELKGQPIPKEKTEPLERLKQYLIAFVNRFYLVSPQGRVDEWSQPKSKSSEKLTTDMEKFPTDAVTIAKFFDGFNPKRKQGRIYLRMRLYSPFQDRMFGLMKHWAELNGFGFQKCIIQAESSMNIGWLAYSDQYTDINLLKRFLENQAAKENIKGIEWGFKIGAVTNTDVFVDKEKSKRREWKYRNEALSVHVPTHKANVATSIISKAFSKEGAFFSRKTLPKFQDKFLFTPPEYTMPDEESSKDYGTLIKRQDFHHRNIIAATMPQIEIDPDQKIITSKKKKVTLRKMILSIKAKKRGRQGQLLNLFQSIDYCVNTKDVWFQGRRGPGGASYLITFYSRQAGEALRMLKGLGVCLGFKYGMTTMVPAFSDDHWAANKGWEWDKKKKTFVTPEEKQMKANVAQDPIDAALEFLAEEEEEVKIAREKQEKQDKEKEAEEELNKKMEEIVVEDNSNQEM